MKNTFSIKILEGNYICRSIRKNTFFFEELEAWEPCKEVTQEYMLERLISPCQ